MARRKGTDLSLSDTDLAEIEKTLPNSPKSAETQYIKLSQGGLKPTWIRVWRRKGIGNAILHTCDAPFRRGEPALVTQVPQSIQLGDGEEACWRLEYADSINKEYPKVVMLPVMDYVWDMLAGDKVGKSYVVRANKGAL